MPFSLMHQLTLIGKTLTYLNSNTVDNSGGSEFSYTEGVS